MPEVKHAWALLLPLARTLTATWRTQSLVDSAALYTTVRLSTASQSAHLYLFGLTAAESDCSASEQTVN